MECRSVRLANLVATILCSALLGAPETFAQGAARIGTVFPGSPSATEFAETAFWNRMRELGWIEGGNLYALKKHAEGHLDRLPALMAELVSDQVNLIVVAGTQGATAASKATSTIPIVGVMGDPVGAGLAQSLARPGANLTGVSVQNAEEVPSKWLELIRETIPDLTSVAVVVNPDNPISQKMVSRVSKAASTVHVKPVVLDVRRMEDYASAFKEARRRTQGVIVTTDAISIIGRYVIAQLAKQYGLPVVAGTGEFTEAGALMSSGPEEKATWRRAADYADRILRGAKPGELPIEQPTKFELVVNLKTARALRITIPDSILLRADEVIR
jgi:putative ABC transport system substrate-binding protein